ncbi:MAG: hypothetical protein KH373_01425 [Ruminococcus sp.]|nr:hypothetical protein [Ruminococcus sp.]
MELTNDDNLIYSHFKGKRVAIFGHLDYLSNKDIERIVQNSKGYYFKSAFENTLDCIILDCKTYAVYNKVFLNLIRILLYYMIIYPKIIYVLFPKSIF